MTVVADYYIVMVTIQRRLQYKYRSNVNTSTAAMPMMMKKMTTQMKTMVCGGRGCRRWT